MSSIGLQREEKPWILESREEGLGQQGQGQRQKRQGFSPASQDHNGISVSRKAPIAFRLFINPSPHPPAWHGCLARILQCPDHHSVHLCANRLLQIQEQLLTTQTPLGISTVYSTGNAERQSLCCSSPPSLPTHTADEMRPVRTHFLRSLRCITTDSKGVLVIRITARICQRNLALDAISTKCTSLWKFIVTSDQKIYAI